MTYSLSLEQEKSLKLAPFINLLNILTMEFSNSLNDRRIFSSASYLPKNVFL